MLVGFFITAANISDIRIGLLWSFFCFYLLSLFCQSWKSFWNLNFFSEAFLGSSWFKASWKAVDTAVRNSKIFLYIINLINLTDRYQANQILWAFSCNQPSCIIVFRMNLIGVFIAKANTAYIFIYCWRSFYLLVKKFAPLGFWAFCLFSQHSAAHAHAFHIKEMWLIFHLL